jgi:hypothetical protein
MNAATACRWSYHSWTRNRDGSNRGTAGRCIIGESKPAALIFQSDDKFLMICRGRYFSVPSKAALTVATHAPFGDYSTGPSAPRST